MSMRKIKPEKMGGEMAMPMSSPKEYYPTVYLDNKTLPEAKDWKVGTTYEVTLQLRMTGFSMRKGRDGKESGSADFDIVGIEPGETVKEGGKSVKRYTETDAGKPETD